MKTCNRCSLVKSVSSFPLRKDRGTVRPTCKDCTKEANRSWRRSRPNYERDRYQSIRTETRERHLVRKYGVTLSDYKRMLAAQKGRCAICGGLETDQHYGVFHVDHCHATGSVRGLLCRGCNHVLGHVKDDPKILERAVVYLASSVVPQIPELIGRAILNTAVPSREDRLSDPAVIARSGAPTPFVKMRVPVCNVPSLGKEKTTCLG